jgi:hypothetical protein
MQMSITDLDEVAEHPCNAPAKVGYGCPPVHSQFKGNPETQAVEPKEGKTSRRSSTRYSAKRFLFVREPVSKRFRRLRPS